MLTRLIYGSRPCALISKRCYSQAVESVTGAASAIPRYTIGDKLTDEQLQFYDKNGFLLVKNLVPHSELDNYKKRFVEIANRRVKIPGMVVQKDVAFKDSQYNENTVYKLQDLYLDSELFKYCQFPPILDIVEKFIGIDMMAIHTMLINKPPDSGKKTSRHPLHQDLLYFPMRPAEKIIAVWTAMEAVNRANGCLVAIPGTHKGPLLDHGYPDWAGVNKAFHGIQNFDKNAERVYIEMEAGDSVFFHPLLVHGSGTNRTTGYRKAISCHYASSDCYYIDVNGTNQQEIADEIIGMAKAKFGIVVSDVAEIWRFRSQLVRGERRGI